MQVCTVAGTSHPPPQVRYSDISINISGFPQALEIMENLENHRGNIMEFEKKTLNNHGKIMEFCEII